MSESNTPRKLGKGKIALIALAAAVIIAALAFWLTADSRAYSRGVELQEAGAYSEAIAVFESIPDHKDARERIDACSYAIALAQMESGEYEAAQAAFAELGDYSDAAEQADECAYQLALMQMESGEYEAAQAAFAELGDYSDAAEQADECAYQLALMQMESGEYEAAQAAFAELGDYSDAAEQADECAYQLALIAEAEGSAADAASRFAALGDHKDSAARAQAIQAALTRYESERERVQAQSDALDAALTDAQALLDEGGTPLDETLPDQLRADTDAARAAKVEMPAEPVTLAEVEAAAEALAAIDYAANTQAVTQSAEALRTSIERYALVDAPDAAFVIDRLSRVPEILRIAAATEDNDPNGNLGKPGGYTAQVYFSSSLVSEAYAYLSDDEIIETGTDCGGSIEVYASREDALQRDAYLAGFDGTILSGGAHTVVGTVVVRASGMLTASQQQQFTDTLIEALTTLEPGPVVEREDVQPQGLGALLEIEEVGYSLVDGRVQYAYVLRNTSETTAVELPQARISFYDENGALLDTDDMIFMAIEPGQRLAWCSTLWDLGELPASAKAEAIEPMPYDLVDRAEPVQPLEVENAAVRDGDYSRALVGEVYNPNDYNIEFVTVIVLYRDADGALLGGEMGYCDAIRAGGTAPFEVTLLSEPQWASYEVIAFAG